MPSIMTPLMKISGFESTLNKSKKPTIARKAPTSNKIAHMILPISSRKSDILSSLFYNYLKNHILIPLNTISSISRIHLVYTAARSCVRALTCGAVIPNCLCFSIRNPDHTLQVIPFYGDSKN